MALNVLKIYLNLELLFLAVHLFLNNEIMQDHLEKSGYQKGFGTPEKSFCQALHQNFFCARKKGD